MDRALHRAPTAFITGAGATGAIVCLQASSCLPPETPVGEGEGVPNHSPCPPVAGWD